MVSEKLKELEAARAKLAALEQSIAAERNAELAALPSRYGFTDTAAFLAAVKAASVKRRGRRPKASQPAAPDSSTGKKRRKRATITDAMRAEVKKLVGAGKSGSEIAKAVGISQQSVQNIKASVGLVKKRK